MKSQSILLGICLCLVHQLSYCQCSTIPPSNTIISGSGFTGVAGLSWSTWATAPTGCPTSGTQITGSSFSLNGTNGAGTLFYASSGSTVSGTLSLNSSSDSALIVVCPGAVLNLTRGGTMNSTRAGILVMPGGTLRTPSAGGFPGKHWLYGAYVPSTDFTIQDANTKFFIAPTGLFQMASDVNTSNSVTLNSSSIGIYSEGAIDVFNLQLNSAPSPFLCLNSASSCTRVRGTYNTSNSNDQIAAGTNGGTLKLDLTTGSVTFNNRVSSSATLKVCTYGLTSYCRNGGGSCCVASPVNCVLQATSPFPNTDYNGSCSSLPSSCNLPLAIKLLYFKAANSPEGVIVRWATALEDRTSSYLIERSANGLDWRSVSEVNAHGDDEYRIIDPTYETGLKYYRLVEIEAGGKIVVQAVTMVDIEKGDFLFRLYPNPSKGDCTIELSNGYLQYTLEIVDITGRIINSYILFPGYNTISGIGAAGIYFARLKIKSDVKVLRIVVQ